MSQKIKILAATAMLLGSSLATFTYAQNQAFICPILTAHDVEEVIDKGMISTDQNYTLAEEANVSRAQVIMNEPTANPFDTYYQMWKSKQEGNQTYGIYVGNLLGKGAFEARERAKQIFLSHKKVFAGEYNPEAQVCTYESINPSPDLSDYPFKTRYETAILLAYHISEESNWMPQRMMMKKHHV